MIRSVALLARRVAGSPDRLARGLAVLAVLAAAAFAMLGESAQARSAGPACAVAGPSVAVMSDAQARALEAGRTPFDRTDIGAADIDAPGDLGLPRRPTEADRPRPIRAASYGHTAETARVPALDGSLHRPPRAA